MLKLLSQYKELDRSVVLVICAAFFIQLIDYSYLTILLVYMNKAGYTDYQAADFYGYRFLSVLLCSFYLGFYINGRKLKPLFYFSAIASPLLSLGIIYAIDYKIDFLVYAGMFMLGIAVLGLEVAILPYMLRNVDERLHTEAISLNYAVANLSSILSGLIIFILTYINPALFNESLILKIISGLGLLGIFCLYMDKKPEFFIPILKRSRYDFRDIKWGRVVKAMIPTFLIATGAGLLIPFMGLFFFKVHGITSDKFALLSSIATIIVFVVMMFAPSIKNKYGFKTAIVSTQSLAVLCLVGLSLSEFYGPSFYALFLAVFCYMFRQPLMNLAMPITSELTMKYVGFRHREIISALTAAIWSGSWFFSSNIFRVLRAHEVHYAYIFYITAGLYLLSISWYYYLASVYEKKEREKIIED
jgi:MFS family permease